jgi:hypothetical protein
VNGNLLVFSDGAFARLERGLGGISRLKFCRPGHRRGAERANLDEVLFAAVAEAIRTLIVTSALSRGEQRTVSLDERHTLIATSLTDAKEATLCIVTFIEGDDDQPFTITGRDDLLRLAEFVSKLISTSPATR